MSLQVCQECTTRYAVGLETCPQCGSAERVEQGSIDAPKPLVLTACTTSGCRYEGASRRVQLRLVALGVVEIPRLGCLGCGAELRTNWLSVQEDPMPKITRHGGPSNAAEPDELGGAASGEADNSETETPQAVDPSPTDPEPVLVGEAGPELVKMPAAAAQADEPVKYEDMTVVQLREECKRRDLSTSGTKAELLERLSEQDGGE